VIARQLISVPQNLHIFDPPHVAEGSKADVCRSNQMSALPPKADIAPGQIDVRFVPKADIRTDGFLASLTLLDPFAQSGDPLRNGRIALRASVMLTPVLVRIWDHKLGLLKRSGSTCSVGRRNSPMHFAPINPITANRTNSPTSRGSETYKL
jgi:hypothetical protein